MIPDKVTIGCYDYEVIETDEVIIVDNIACKGSIDYDRKRIKIKADMVDQQKEQTLWHEIVHGIINYRQFTPANIDLETCVEEMALDLYGVMKSNGLLPGQQREGG